MSTKLYNILRTLKKDEIIKLSNKKCKHGHSLVAHPNCLHDYLNRNDRVGFLDIETSNLVATYGYIISYCIKEQDGKIIHGLMEKRDFMDGSFDKRVVSKLVEDLKSFDKVYTFYGCRFDIPFIRSRALFHNLEFPVYKEVAHKDLYFTVRHKLRLHSNRLKTVCDFLGIESKLHPLTPAVWHRAATGDKEALKYILEHNKEDVISTEALFKRVIQFGADNNTSM